MATDFTIKQHDQLPELVCTLTDARNTTVDLTGVLGIRFIMKVKGAAATMIDAAADIVDVENGVVKYAWDFGDTDTAGKFLGEFEVKFGDNRVETFPNSKYINILIVGDLGGVGV